MLPEGLHPEGLHPGGLAALQVCLQVGFSRPLNPQGTWDTMGYCQQAGGTHPTGMHSCLMSIFICTDYQRSCGKVMFSAMCVCHSVYRRGWVSTQSPGPSPLSLFQFQPCSLYNKGSPTQTCSNLCNLDLTIQGPSVPPQTCSNLFTV